MKAMNLALVTVVTAPDSSYFQSVKKFNEIYVDEEGTSSSRFGSTENSHR
jgi:hypothetical protein